MIAYLKGVPKVVNSELVVVVQGVGYAVFVSNATLAASSNQPEIELEIYTHVREDALELYGFKTQHERTLFTLLLAISGVGPKTALTITEKGAEGITQAVQAANISFFSSVPRVGKKLAQKIIIDLTSKLGSIKELQLTPLSTFQSDLSAALVSLGFSEQDIETLIRDDTIANMSLETALQYCLKQLGPQT